MNYKNEIKDILVDLNIGLESEEIYNTIETPPNKEMGDFAFPTFKLAKTLRKADRKSVV